MPSTAVPLPPEASNLHRQGIAAMSPPPNSPSGAMRISQTSWLQTGGQLRRHCAVEQTTWFGDQKNWRFGMSTAPRDTGTPGQQNQDLHGTIEFVHSHCPPSLASGS